VKALKHSSLNLKGTSLTSKWMRGFTIFKKSFMNHWLKPTCPRKLLIPFIEEDGGNLSITSTFALSTSIALY